MKEKKIFFVFLFIFSLFLLIFFIYSFKNKIGIFNKIYSKYILNQTTGIVKKINNNIKTLNNEIISFSKSQINKDLYLDYLMNENLEKKIPEYKSLLNIFPKLTKFQIVNLNSVIYFSIEKEEIDKLKLKDDLFGNITNFFNSNSSPYYYFLDTEDFTVFYPMYAEDNKTILSYYVFYYQVDRIFDILKSDKIRLELSKDNFVFLSKNKINITNIRNIMDYINNNETNYIKGKAIGGVYKYNNLNFVYYAKDEKIIPIEIILLLLANMLLLIGSALGIFSTFGQGGRREFSMPDMDIVEKNAVKNMYDNGHFDKNVKQKEEIKDLVESIEKDNIVFNKDAENKINNMIYKDAMMNASIIEKHPGENEMNYIEKVADESDINISIDIDEFERKFKDLSEEPLNLENKINIIEVKPTSEKEEKIEVVSGETKNKEIKVSNLEEIKLEVNDENIKPDDIFIKPEFGEIEKEEPESKIEKELIIDENILEEPEKTIEKKGLDTSDLDIEHGNIELDINKEQAVVKEEEIKVELEAPELLEKEEKILEEEKIPVEENLEEKTKEVELEEEQIISEKQGIEELEIKEENILENEKFEDNEEDIKIDLDHLDISLAEEEVKPEESIISEEKPEIKEEKILQEKPISEEIKLAEKEEVKEVSEKMQEIEKSVEKIENVKKEIKEEIIEKKIETEKKTDLGLPDTSKFNVYETEEGLIFEQNVVIDENINPEETIIKDFNGFKNKSIEEETLVKNESLEEKETIEEENINENLESFEPPIKEDIVDLKEEKSEEKSIIDEINEINEEDEAITIDLEKLDIQLEENKKEEKAVNEIKLEEEDISKRLYEKEENELPNKIEEKELEEPILIEPELVEPSIESKEIDISERAPSELVPSFAEDNLKEENLNELKNKENEIESLKKDINKEEILSYNKDNEFSLIVDENETFFDKENIAIDNKKKVENIVEDISKPEEIDNVFSPKKEEEIQHIEVKEEKIEEKREEKEKIDNELIDKELNEIKENHEQTEEKKEVKSAENFKILKNIQNYINIVTNYAKNQLNINKINVLKRDNNVYNSFLNTGFQDLNLEISIEDPLFKEYISKKKGIAVNGNLYESKYLKEKVSSDDLNELKEILILPVIDENNNDVDGIAIYGIENNNDIYNKNSRIDLYNLSISNK